MKSRSPLASGVSVFLGCVLTASAQSTVGNTAVGKPGTLAADEAVTLTPFVVDASGDAGWSGTDTLMANRTRQALKDVPFSIDAITSDFMEDLNLATADDVGRFVAGTYAAFQMENDNDADGFAFRGIAASGGTAATNLTRNYFRSPIPSDSYNVERIDFGKGSNSLVFGDSDPGGQGAVATKRATFRNFGRAFVQYGSEDAYRAELDLNRKITDRVALRLNLVQRDQKTFQDFSQYTLKAGTLALTWKPFKNTEIRLEGEKGTFSNNRGFTGIQVREVSARSLGYATGFWYYTSDGAVINGTTLPAADRNAANSPAGGALTLLAGQAFDVQMVNAAGAFVGTKRINGLPMNANLRGKFDLFARPFDTYSLFVEQRVGKLGLEFGYNHQNQNGDRNDAAFSSAISVDVNGRPYIGVDSLNRKYIGDEVDAFRLLGALPWQPCKWMRQQFVGSLEYRIWSHDQYRIRLLNYAGVDNGTQIRIGNPEQIRFRAYLDDPLFYSGAFFDKFELSRLPHTSTFRPGWWSYDNSDTYYEKSWAAAFSATGSYFNGRVQTVLGLRHDNNVRHTYVGGALHRDAVGAQLPAVRFKDAAPGDYVLIPNLDYAHQSGSAGVTVALNRNLNLYGVWSTSFKAQDAITFDNKILGPITGLSKEVGLKGDLFERRASFSVGAFQIDRQNAAFGWLPNTLTGAQLNDLFNPNNLAASDPAYRTFQTLPANLVASTESSRGFDATMLVRPLSGLQVRLTIAKIDLRTTPEFGSFRALLAEATARGNESPALLADAQLALDSSDLPGKPIGPRGSPWSGSWVFDYAFSRGTGPALRGVRIGINGFWRQNYLLGIRNNLDYRGGATHIVGAYLLRDQKIWGRDLRIRLGAKNLFDFANGDVPRKTGIVTRQSGVTVYGYSYIMPAQYDAAVTVRF